MDKSFNSMFDNIPLEDMSNLLINFSKLRLNRMEHIKKYNKLRNLHSDIMESMDSYISDKKYNVEEYFNVITNDVLREIGGGEFELNTYNSGDKNIFFELFLYKNHKKIPSVTDVYLEKKKFRNEEKLKLLNSMKNSYVGLFKIVDVDKNNGYVFYEDVFTHKKFKVIDISMSSTILIDEKIPIYVYNRVITYEDISFGTGIHCMFKGENKSLQNFIKTHKYYKCSDFSRCILLYMLFKENKNLKITFNNQYGNRR